MARFYVGTAEYQGEERTWYNGLYGAHAIRDATLTMKRNLIPSLEFTLYPDNTCFDFMHAFQTYVTLTKIKSNMEELTRDVTTAVYMDDLETIYLFNPANPSADKSTNTIYVSGDYTWHGSTTGEDNETWYLINVVQYAEIGTFDGRVIDVSDNVDSDGLHYRVITCEGAMGYLNDTIQPFLETQTWTDIPSYLSYVLSVHNSHEKNEKEYIYLGDCDVVSSDYTDGHINKGTNFETTWEILKEKLVYVYGGEIEVVKRSDGKHYLNYMKQLGTNNEGQEIALGSNISAIEVTFPYATLISRFYPLGKIIETNSHNQDVHLQVNTSGTYTDPDGTSTTYTAAQSDAYIDDSAAYALVGLVEGMRTWSDITTPAGLLTKGKEWLAKNNECTIKVNLNAYDLEYLGAAEDTYTLYDYFKVTADMVAVYSSWLELTKLAIDIIDVRTISLILGYDEDENGDDSD